MADVDEETLKYILQDLVTLEETADKIIWGKLNVENTGLEFVYPAKHKDEGSHDETSYILYKYEYPNIAALCANRTRIFDLRFTIEIGCFKRE